MRRLFICIVASIHGSLENCDSLFNIIIAQPSISLSFRKHSNKLKDHFVIAKTVAEAKFLSRNQEHVVYSEDEIKLLRGQKESLLSFVHEAKKILGPEFAHVVDIEAGRQAKTKLLAGWHQGSQPACLNKKKEEKSRLSELPYKKGKKSL
jgi:hypothetical protein